MSARIAPFGAYLPYWTTLPVALPQGASSHVPIVVLKDGTVAIGLQCAGADIYAASNALLNRHAEVLNKALCELPAKAYLQICFESGLRYDDLIERFAQQGHAASPTLLQWGRSQRAQRFKKCAYLTRCAITYWIGWRGALQDITPSVSGLAKWRRALGLRRVPLAKQVHQAATVVLSIAKSFIDTASQMDLLLTYLDEQEVLAACHRAINPSMYERLPAPLLDDPPLQRATPLSAQLALSPLKYNDTRLVTGEPPILMRALGVTRLPQTTAPDALHAVMYDRLPKRPFRLVITHEATDPETSRRRLEHKRRLTTGMMGRVLVNHQAAQAFENLDQLIERSANTSRLFETHLVAIVSGYNEDELDEAARDVRRGFEDKSIACATLVDEQLQAWRGSLPANGYNAPKITTLLGQNCAHLTPYWLPSTGEPEAEILLENRQRGLECLTVRPGPVREHAGAVVVGALGSGKTFIHTHLLKYGVLNLGGHVVLVDNKGPKNSSYRPLCELLGGTYVALENNDAVAFNPVPPRHEVMHPTAGYQSDQVDALVRILCMMAVADLDTTPDVDYWRTIARDVVRLTYESSAPHATLTLSDILKAFEHYQPAMPRLLEMAAQMQERLYIWLQDPRRNHLFNRPEHADLSNPFTVFDFFGMDKDPQASAVLISVLASRIEAKLVTLPRTTPKLFGFDEAWQMFNAREACALLNRLYRVVRSYGGFCYVLTQNYADIDKSPARDGILSNTSLIYLMRHLEGHKQVAQLLDLTPRELELFESLVMQANQYAECLLVDRHENRTHLLQYWATPFDIWCDTSRPMDVEMRNAWLHKLQLPLEEVIHRLAERYPNGAPKQSTSSRHSSKEVTA